MDKRVEVFDRGLGVLRDLVDELHRRVVPYDEFLGERELDPQGDQMLLASVMQITFDAAAFGIRYLPQARPRVVQLANMEAELVLESLVCEPIAHAAPPSSPDRAKADANREHHNPGGVADGDGGGEDHSRQRKDERPRGRRNAPAAQHRMRPVRRRPRARESCCDGGAPRTRGRRGGCRQPFLLGPPGDR